MKIDLRETGCVDEK